MSRSKYKFYNMGYPYFLTCTIVGWVPIFTNPDIIKITIDALSTCQSEYGLHLHGYVIMKDHLHLIAQHENLSRIIGQFKSASAAHFLRYYQWHNNTAILARFADEKKAHKRNKFHQIWQEGSHPEEITHEAMFLQKLDYIHFNPIRAGYVERPEDWPYSSARNYAEMKYILPITAPW
jgi:REP element-mobilizing transposase RayT